MTKKFHDILQYPDKKLFIKSREVKKGEADLKILLEDLKKLAKSHSKNGITLVGLSAPQVGINIRAFIFFDFKQRKYIDVINPKLTYSSKEHSNEWEGCASVGTGKKSLFGPVSRPRFCQISFMDIDWNEHMLSASNYLSHILLHEIDHLEGIIFLERVIDKKMIMTAAELDAYAKKHEGKYPEL